MKRPHTTVVVLVILAVVLGCTYVTIHTPLTQPGVKQSAATFMPMSANSPGPVDIQVPSSAYVVK